MQLQLWRGKGAPHGGCTGAWAGRHPGKGFAGFWGPESIRALPTSTLGAACPVGHPAEHPAPQAGTPLASEAQHCSPSKRKGLHQSQRQDPTLQKQVCALLSFITHIPLLQGKMLSPYLLPVPQGSAPSLRARAGYIPSQHGGMMADSVPAFCCLNPELSPPPPSPPPPRCLLPLGFLSCPIPRSFRSRRRNLASANPGQPGPGLPRRLLSMLHRRDAPSTSPAASVTGSIWRGKRLSRPCRRSPTKGPGKNRATALHRCCPTVLNQPPTPSLTAGLLVPGHGGPAGAAATALYRKTPGMEASRKVQMSPARSLLGVTTCSVMPSTPHAIKNVFRKTKYFFPKVLSPLKKTSPERF